MKIKVQNIEGKASGDIELSDDVFGIEPHKLVEASGGAVIDLKRS